MTQPTAAPRRGPAGAVVPKQPAGWYSKATSVAVAVLIWKTLAVFEGYWWEETMLMTALTLLCAALIEVALPKGYRAAKSVFQAILSLILIAVVASAYGELTWQRVSAEDGGLPKWLEIHFAQLSAFIWICAAVLILYTMFIHWATTRTRLFAVLSAVLLTLTVADSFTPVWLWDEVAWVVLTGLLWLVANHLSGFQSKHPGNWKALLRSPFQLFVPVAAVLAVLMTGGLIMPSISPLLQDPYTIWKESKGEQVGTFIGDKADADNPLSNMDSSSGYGRNDTNLGGGFNYDYSPVMTVESSRRSYWRGETKDVYTGTGWLDSEAAASRFASERVGLRSVLPGEDRYRAETVKVEQTVRMIREEPYPVLFAAQQATSLNWVNDPDASRLNPPLFWSEEDGELRLYEGAEMPDDGYDGPYPGAYSVTSEAVVLDEEALRQTHAGWEDASRNAPYLQLPGELPERVKELAEEVTAAAASDYDKAKMLEQYLRSAYPYTNQPDLSKLRGSDSTDFVDQFLFVLEEGYCDYFSTAMAVMGRAIGLPTRWVKGFAPGALPVADPGPGGFGPEELMEMNPDGAGTYTVRNSDAHSWVEVYFEGFGWIPFEPTSGFSYPYSVPETDSEPIPSSTPEETDKTPAQPETEQNNGSGVPFRLIGWTAAVLLAAAAAFWAYARRHAIASAWEAYRFRSFTADERIVWETERLLRKCKRRGLVRGEHETIREAIGRWNGTGSQLKRELHEVIDRFELAKYSPVQASSEDAERFASKVKAIIEQVK
ncbi:DUF3488 and DUF4129 domain-containing transglutaminase family protein [Paenibacillus thailandensis]|uniref:DUF3488 and DUF4129 domain-containing transglutaminase family protein n=1 Tax=Paenibacillus thailandensis TaxID=393250 RepID=A0ABW5QTS3_9BACL